MSKIEVELYALSDMNTALRKLDESAKDALGQISQVINTEITRLQGVEQQRRQEVNQCQAAYDRCRSYRDREGRTPPCSSELNALQTAQNRLADIQSHIGRFSDQVANYSTQANRFQQTLDSNIHEGRSYLDRHIQEGLRFLKTTGSSALGSVSGTGDHGSRYQRARREFFERGASGELPSMGRNYTGWMRQEVNRGGYYRTYSYHDVGHYVAGVDIPENFRWEDQYSNRTRPHRARRHNLDPVNY